MVEIKLLSPLAKIPERATEGSAYDIWATEIKEIETPKGRHLVIHTGIAIAPPKGYRTILQLRSSSTKEDKCYWYMNNQPGLIDNDYRSEIIIKLTAVPIYGDTGWTYPENPYDTKNAVAQIYFEKIENFDFIVVDELSVTERTGGFGSTNIN